jgi:DnaB helicase-like protein/AAA domain-containing protein
MKARVVTNGPWPSKAQQSNAPPPHSVEAEQGVLGSMLQERGGKEAIAEAIQSIDATQFYVPAHQLVFTAISDLYEAGEAVDLITFTQHLRDRKLLESVGGAAFVTSLFTFVPTAANVGYYLEIVRDKYVLRQAVAAGTELVRRAYEEQDEPAAVLDEILSKAESLRSVHGLNGVMQDGAALLSKSITVPPDVIAGVVHRGGKLLLGGASKSYKTWLLIDLGVSVASGSEWLSGCATNKGRVLYINFELPEAFCAKRIQAVCDERQIKLEPGMLTVWNLRGSVREWAQLQRQIPRGKFDLIIVDPIYKLLLFGVGVRDENAAGHIAAMLDEMEVLAVRSGAAVAFGAHYSKGNQAAKESIDRISGSGVFARDPDSILNFTKHEQSDCFTVEMTFRNHPPREAFVVKWEYPLFVSEATLDPSRLKQAGRPRDEEFSADNILDLLDKAMSTEAWQKLAYKELNVSRATFFRRKCELEKAGKIQRVKGGKWSEVSK